MPPKRKPTKSTANPRRAAVAARVKKASSTTTKAIPVPQKKPEKTFDSIVAGIKKDLNGTRIHVLSMPWEARGIAQVNGVKYHPDLKQYLYEGYTLPPVLQPYRSEDFSLERWIQDELNGRREPIQDFGSRMTPRDHQKTAIKKIMAYGKAGWRGFIVADNVGVGKSLSTILGAYGVARAKGFTAQRPASLLIISPKAVIPHWKNTIRASGADNLRIVVINYDQAKKLLSTPASAEDAVRARTKNKNIALNGKPIIRWDIIIADEAHKMKNVSQRTNAFNRIARYAEKAETAPFVMWASATIGQNPLEVAYLAPIVSQMSGGKPILVKEWGDWLITHGFSVKKTPGGNFSWIKARTEHSQDQKDYIEKQQLADVNRLAGMLFGEKSPSIRRNPEDIAGWPTQSHFPVPIELDGPEERLYQEAWNEFRHHMQLHPRGKNPSGGLAATLRFQQKASLITAPETSDFANDLLDNGLQVAISVRFIETLDAIKESLEKSGWTVAEFSGRNNLERENERLRFQRGEAQVILFTVEEGISLHAKEQLASGQKATANQRALLIHDIRYSSIAMSQILGRATRDGELAKAYYMYAEDTIESKILKVMLGKMKNMRSLSGDDEETTQAIYDLLDGI